MASSRWIAPRAGAVALLFAAMSQAGAAAVGRTPGLPAVTPGGEAAYTIPLRLPEGTAGMTPALSLEYRHRADGGVAGIGWHIGGLSRIHRCPRTIAQDGQAGPIRQLQSDRFCLDGERLVVINGQGYGTSGAEYRTEVETYARIRTVGTAGTGPAQFVVEAVDGRIFEYGATADSRIDVGGVWTAGSATARIWALNRIRDRAGNVVDFRYVEDAQRGSYRLTTVEYTANPAAGVAPAWQVAFVYENRPGSDADFASEGGVVVSDIVRLDRIDLLQAGAVVRRYELDYEPALSAAGRSRLAAVRECGQGGAECLAPTTFDWQDGEPGLDVERAVAAGTGGSSSIPDALRWWSADISGDGRDDLVWTGGTTSAPTLRYRLAQAAGGMGPEVDTGVAVPGGAGVPLDYDGDGFTDVLTRSVAGRWQVLRGGSGGLGAPLDTGLPARGIDYRAADMDGNGLPDLVYSEVTGSSGNGLEVRVLYNRPGTGFSPTPVTLYEQAFNTSYERPQGGDFLGPPGRRIDLDGDGREDVLMNEDYSIARIAADQSVSEVFAGSFRGGVPADLNGDGCTDFIYPHYTGSWRARISACRVSSQTREVAGPSAAGLVPGSAVAMDWDGDGRDDLLYRDASSAWRVVRSTGSSLLASGATGLAHGTPAGVRAADVDGDGLHDLVTRAATQLRYREHRGAAPDLLRAARDGLGVLAAFEYAPLTREGLHVRGTGAAWPDQDLQDARQVIVRLDVSDGTGSDAVVGLDYTYEGLRRNGIGRGDLGFARRISTRAVAGATLREIDSYRQEFPFIGLVDGARLERANGRRIRESEVEWTSVTLGSGPAVRRHPYPLQSTVRNHAVGGMTDGAGYALVTIRVGAIDPQTGLVTDRSVTVTESAGGSNPGASHTRRVRHTSALTDTSSWCVGRPQATEVTVSHTLPGGDAVTTSAALDWDGVGCRIVRAQLEPGSSEWRVVTDYAYDRFGNVTTQGVTGAGMSPRVARIDWGSTGQRPLRITNALSQSTMLSWSTATGLPLSATDANGMRTSWSYDPFARLVLETRPDGTRKSLERARCAGDCDALARYRITLHERDDAGAVFRSTLVDLDRFERPVAFATQLPGGGFAGQRTEFDALGRIARQYLPAWSGSHAPGYWQYAYDAVDRVTSASLHDAAGSMRYSTRVDHDGLAATITDPRGYRTVRRFAAWGDPLEVVDALGGTSRYRHDAAGRLLQATDALGNVVASATYNVRGMRVALRDMNLGSWSFSHDALGALTARTDARGRTATYSYDALGRPIRRAEPEGTTTWTWGSSASARNIGRLVAVAGPGYSESYAYDSRGRLATRSITSDATYQYSYSYNRLGLPDSLSYPVSTSNVRFRLSYAYTNGYLTSIADAASSGGPLWRLGAVDAAGRVLEETLGAGLRVVTGYDPVSGEMEYRQTGSASGSTLQDLAWEWDAAGNLVSRADLRRGLREQFEHDALGRLDRSRLNGVVNLDLRYDATGNITWKSDVCPGTSPCYAYDPVRRNAVVTAGSGRFYYDANGNMTSRGGAPLGWTSYNLPSYIGASGSSNYSQFWYAPDRSRWKQVSSDARITETRVYVGGLLEKVTRAGVTTWRHRVESPTGFVALYVRDGSGGPSRLHYLLGDHLGSVDKVVDASGSGINVAESFDAFGKRRGPDWAGSASAADLAAIAATTRAGFTGHEQLDHLGLIHMNGRVYDPGLGRFVSADPSIHAPFEAQDLNRYSYAWNRPLGVTDPTGAEEVDCLRAPGGPCQQITVTGLRDARAGSTIRLFGGGSAQVASAAERDPCGQDGSAAACNGLSSRSAIPAEALDPAGLLAQFGEASLNAIPGWHYSGQAAAALERGELLSAVLFYGGAVGDVFLLGRASSAILASRYAQAELAIAKAVHYGPLRRGPLPERVAATFRSSSYTERILDEPLTVYRVVGSGGRADGNYWTTLEPHGALQSVVDLAIDQNWRNPATQVIRARIPAGTIIYEGPTSAQRGLVGGAPQVYITRVDPGWLQ